MAFFISSHSASEVEDMANLAAETKDMGFQLEQLQVFTSASMTLAIVFVILETIYIVDPKKGYYIKFRLYIFPVH